MGDTSQVVAQSQRRADKAPLDGRYRFDTLEAATAEAYDGAFFYVVSTKEWYKFFLNAQGVLVVIADSAVDVSQFALKTDLNGLATSVLASASNDGMMKSTDFIKLAGIDTTRITKVRSSSTNGNVLINDAETPVYIHPDTATLRHVTDTEKEAWNSKAAGVHYHNDIYSPISHNHNTIYAPIAHEHQVWDNGLGRYREKYVLADSAGSGGNATTLGGLSLNNNATGVGADDAVWSASKVIATVDAKANEIALGNSWKPAVATFADIATTYPNPVDGWTVPVKDIDHSWRFNGTEWVDLGGVMPLATQSIDGKMSAADKAKLDGVAEGANNFVHPAQHLASIILEETDKRFMTDAERAKLAGVAENANNFVHPANHPASMITEEADKRFMTDGVQNFLGRFISFTSFDSINKTPQEYLGTVNNNAPEYVISGVGGMCGILFSFGGNHSNNGYQLFLDANGDFHSRSGLSLTTWSDWKTFFNTANLVASMITEEPDRRFMLDAEREKLDTVAEYANNFVHPANHPASMVVEEADKRFMLDTEREKLDTVAEYANNFVHPANHPASMVVEEADKWFMTDAEKSNVAKVANTLAISGYLNGATLKKPNEYTGQNMFWEYVNNTNIGINPTAGWMNGVLLTYPPSVSGFGNQVFFSALGIIARRVATSATAWGVWITFFDSSNLGAATTSVWGLMSPSDKTKMDAITGTNTGNETTTTIGTLINGATAKTTPVDADMVGLMDSAASNGVKKLSWANIKATLKTYFDTIYTTRPATTVDHALVRFNGTTGAIQASTGATLDDTGVLTVTDIIIP